MLQWNTFKRWAAKKGEWQEYLVDAIFKAASHVEITGKPLTNVVTFGDLEGITELEMATLCMMLIYSQNGMHHIPQDIEKKTKRDMKKLKKITNWDEVEDVESEWEMDTESEDWQYDVTKRFEWIQMSATQKTKVVLAVYTSVKSLCFQFFHDVLFFSHDTIADRLRRVTLKVDEISYALEVEWKTLERRWCEKNSMEDQKKLNEEQNEEENTKSNKNNNNASSEDDDSKQHIMEAKANPATTFPTPPITRSQSPKPPQRKEQSRRAASTEAVEKKRDDTKRGKTKSVRNQNVRNTNAASSKTKTPRTKKRLPSKPQRKKESPQTPRSQRQPPMDDETVLIERGKKQLPKRNKLRASQLPTKPKKTASATSRESQPTSKDAASSESRLRIPKRLTTIKDAGNATALNKTQSATSTSENLKKRKKRIVSSKDGNKTPPALALKNAPSSTSTSPERRKAQKTHSSKPKVPSKKKKRTSKGAGKAGSSTSRVRSKKKNKTSTGAGNAPPSTPTVPSKKKKTRKTSRKDDTGGDGGVRRAGNTGTKNTSKGQRRSTRRAKSTAK